jgi:HPt (histidine-containing phosphotransfer) domain-containing protein
MPSLKLLLVEDDPVRSDRLSKALTSGGIDAFAVARLQDAVEALGINQFDVILVGSSEQSCEPGKLLCPAVRRFTTPPLVLIYGNETRDACDGIIALSTELDDLAGEISKIRLSACLNPDRIASQLTAFDLAAFRDQMGDDPQLMNEIVSLFFLESEEQLRDLRSKVSAHEHQRVSRIAHSLKGSLGSLHATHAHYWAQALESASNAKDAGRSETCLRALEHAITALKPELQSFILK